MFDVVAIGNPVFDIIITPYVQTSGRVLSGCSTNAALAVGKLGGRAGLIGKIGPDFEQVFIEVSRKYGVEAYPIESEESGGFYLKYLDERMDHRELKVIGIAGSIDFHEIPSRFLDSKSFVIGPILKEIDFDLVKNLLEHVDDDAIVFVDPQGLIRELNEGKVVRIANKGAYDIMSLVHFTKPNEHEANVLFPNMQPPEIAEEIEKKSKIAGIVTVAERGSYIAFEGKVYHIPAYRTTERDPTGCGDVYAGAFTYYYIKTGDILESAIFASAAASFMVETTGPDFSLHFCDVKKRFEAIHEQVRRIK
ncbi:MAG: PfkB family carbohydrate kinase [Candidatus Njordarchaeia archaeon]